ncbi:MAG: TatD family hydrolase [Oscillospiraceae bacterium]|nr:TatD family hydrolase [Oscillospiraceae bacterium]
MQLIDSHAHLDDRQYNNDRASVIEDIRASGITNVINIGADMRSSRASVKLAAEHDFIYATVGVHPHYAKSMTDESIAELKALAANPKVVAIGEIGLDYFRNNSPRDVQQYWFRKQLQLAKELNLPVVIHDRDAHADCIEILKSEIGFPKNESHCSKFFGKDEQPPARRSFSDGFCPETSNEGVLRGVMHCYSGSAEMAEQLINMGFYISFGGVVTFKNARVAIDALRMLPIDRLLIETDCPYLSPEPHRGERNTSAYMPLITQKVAEIKGLSYEEVCNITAENTRKLFGF